MSTSRAKVRQERLGRHCITMSRRLPACDPCRSSKLSCDHTKPVCSRCRNRDMTDECSYRDRPFKKRKAQAPLENTRATPQSAPAASTFLNSPDESSKNLRRYPNPGYLGSSSHTTFFDHLSGNDRYQLSNDLQEGRLNDSGALGCSVTEDKLEQGAAFIAQIRTSEQLAASKSLVQAWVNEGINLPVAEPFTLFCADASCSAIDQRRNETAEGSGDLQTAAVTSRNLFLQSCRPLTIGTDDTLEAFGELFCRDYARWETLGIFFTAISRATIDITRFDGLYSSEQERHALRKLAMRFSDTCLDIALSLDCLNDLQLILQYENFILHSLVDGDQSKSCFIKMLLDSLLPPSSIQRLYCLLKLADDKWLQFALFFARYTRIVYLYHAASSCNSCSTYSGQLILIIQVTIPGAN